MPASLPVELNHDRIHEIRAVGEFQTDGPFVVDLVNDGEAVHVHVNLDEELSRVASLDATNHYVESGSTASVPVDVAPVDEAVAGELTVATGYGAETAEVTVTVQPWEDHGSGVAVDEDLATPATSEVEEPTARRPSVPLLALAGAAVVVAVVVGYHVRTPPVLVGVGVVVGAAVAAVVASLR